MGLLKDFYQHELTIRKRYWFREIFNPFNWKRNIQYRHQRAERGWSTRDTWGGGEYLAGVAEGILRYLDREQNPIDWEHYFRENYPNNYGYTSITEVADDIELYLWWQEEQYEDPLYSELNSDDRWAIEIQLYSQLQNAMHFTAENIGHLWW